MSRTVILLTSLAWAVIVFLPPVMFFAAEQTVSGIAEEFVGYRYFYSLRLAYGGEHPWLPQGQAVTLIHVLIQYLLSLSGRPIDELFPRVDLFALVAALLPGVVTVIAAYLAFGRFSRAAALAIVAALTLALMTSRDLPFGGAWTLMPDYHAWVVPLAFACIALLLREPAARSRWHVDLLCGAFLVGLAASVKLTFAVFPLSVLAVLAYRARLPWRDAAEWMSVSLAIALIAYLCVILIYGGVDGFLAHFGNTLYFLQTQNTTLPHGSAFKDLILKSQIGTVVFLSPFLLLSLGIAKREPLAVIVSLFGILSLVLASMRPYLFTLIETYAFAAVELAVAVWIAERLWRSNWPWRAGAVAACGAAAFWIGYFYLFDIRANLAYARSIGTPTAEWRSALRAGPFPVWILTTGNTYRPNSIESGLCKGGMDIFDPRWGASPFLENLFPNFKCAVVTAGRPSAPPSGAIGFLHLPEETLQSATRRVEKYFSISLAAHSCREIAAPNHVLVICRPKRTGRGPG